MEIDRIINFLYEKIKNKERIFVEEENKQNILSDLKGSKKNLSFSEKKRLLDKMSRYRKYDIDYIYCCIITFSLWEPDEAIIQARKKGVFRYNAWGLKENQVQSLLKKLYSYSKKLNYSIETIKYLDTKIKLSWMFDFYKESENKLKKFIEQHHKDRKRKIINEFIFEEGLFKELLVYLDCLFYNDYKYSSGLNKDKLSGYSKEEISESISYLIFLYDDVVGIKDNVFYMVSPDFINSKDIENIILLGCKIYQMQEWELSIDYFNYLVDISNNNYLIYSSNPQFEKSIKLGFINNVMQKISFFSKKELLDEESFTLPNLAKLISFEHGDNLIKSVGNGALSRYIVGIPEKYFELLGNRDIFFLDENAEIEFFAQETCLSVKDTLNRKITSNCTLKDIILFKRFFLFSYLITYKTLYKRKKKDKVLRSLIPGFSYERLFKNLVQIIGDEQKTIELLSLFTYKKGVKLDLQYTPLLNASNMLVFSASITSRSNLLRNSIAYSYILKNQIVNKTEVEPLVKQCKDIFSARYPKAKILINQKFKYQKLEGELDVLIIFENDILIMECKAPLTPTSNFEMRSSLSHIDKAVKQLDLSVAAFSDKNFRKQFFKNAHVEEKRRTIHTCIVFGNRLFNGMFFGNHPLRYIRELNNILNIGKIVSSAGDWNIWKNGQYSHSELIKYLSKDNPIAISSFNSMDEIEEYMHVKGKKISFKSFELVLVKQINEYDKMFECVSKNEKIRDELNTQYKKILSKELNKEDYTL